VFEKLDVLSLRQDEHFADGVGGFFLPIHPSINFETGLGTGSAKAGIHGFRSCSNVDYQMLGGTLMGQSRHAIGAVGAL
jgi:hypothetical protein